MPVIPRETVQAARSTECPSDRGVLNASLLGTDALGTPAADVGIIGRTIPWAIREHRLLISGTARLQPSVTGWRYSVAASSAAKKPLTSLTSESPDNPDRTPSSIVRTTALPTIAPSA